MENKIKESMKDIERKMIQANTETDQGDIHIHISKKRERIKPLNTFALCFTACLASIIDKHGLSANAIRLLLELLNISQAGNLISINQKGLAKVMGWNEKKISRAMVELRKSGIVLDKEIGTFLNPQVITKQGLDIIASKHRAQVEHGIQSLERNGIDRSWELPRKH